MRFSIPWFFAAGRMYLRKIACPQHGFRPRYRLLAKTQSSDFRLAERSCHCTKVSASRGWSVLRETAQLLEIDGAIIGRYRGYEKAAELIGGLPESI